MEQLSDIGEDELIKRIVSQLANHDKSVLVGPGDDCAVVDVERDGYYQLLKTDSVLEGIHYLRTADPREVGWKAVARVVSDFAAMGGEPSQLLITIALPRNTEVEYVNSLYEGMNHCAVSHGAVISGGETTTTMDGAGGMISVSGTGWVKRGNLITRSAGQPGDVILVTGQLGGSIRGKHLTFQPRLKEALWLANHCEVNAMMDLSDGLASDLPRLAKASDCGFFIDHANIPCSDGCDVAAALSDGEDYELLLTVSRSNLDQILNNWEMTFPTLPLTIIGELISEKETSNLEVAGWEHFKSR